MAGFVPLVRAGGWTPLVGSAEPARPSPAGPVAPAPPSPRPGPPPEAPEADLLALAAARKAEQRAHAEAMAELGRLQESARAEGLRLQQIATALEALRDELVSELRAHAAELVLAGVEHVAGQAIRREPGVLEGLLAEALASLGHAELVVRVAPEDEARAVAWVGARPVRVVPDPMVRAGCVASSPSGVVDATLDTALASLRHSLRPFARPR